MNLNGIDGKVLLEAMHNHSNNDSLVYWLEFKNDDEFPTPKFGGIAGGSALALKKYFLAFKFSPIIAGYFKWQIFCFHPLFYTSDSRWDQRIKKPNRLLGYDLIATFLI